MRKTNWGSFEKQAKNLKSVVKSTSQVREFLNEYPEPGYMRDNISKNQVLIKDCKSSSLRRYVKLLNKFYYLPIDEKNKEKILEKKIEIENELTIRPDGLAELPKKPKRKGGKKQ